MLTSEQASVVKKQIIEQIEKRFPAEKKDFAKKQILAMNSAQLEEFLKKNNIKVTGLDSVSNQCVFCAIVSGQIDSYKIGENAKALAVLEINPLSKGHTIVIPKEHIPSSDKMPAQTFSLAKEIGKKLKSRLKAKKVEISSANIFGHEIINVIPIYENKTPSERQRAKPEELLELQKTLSKEKEKKIRKMKKSVSKKSEKKIWLPRRIP